jgi:hypothetical protein
MARGEIRWAVFTLRFGQDGLDREPALGAWMRANARLVAQFGDYVIFEPPRPGGVAP